jgi:hypothetical protein
MKVENGVVKTTNLREFQCFFAKITAQAAATAVGDTDNVVELQCTRCRIVKISYDGRSKMFEAKNVAECSEVEWVV